MQRPNDTRVLVVGGASLDTLDCADHLVAGGAGMYTAMAAWRSQASVSLFAPRPNPVPTALQPVASNLTWFGPTVAQQDLARFEITYRNGRTTYVQAEFGAEDSLLPDELPDDLSDFDCVHLIPLGSLRRQYEFLRACRDRGARRVSAGTALDLIDDSPEHAVRVANEADYFFMNEEEAERLFGSIAAVTTAPGQTIFVTQGKLGATVVQGDVTTRLPAVGARVVDPTGAGDTFCGATIVGLSRGMHPVMAARMAMPLSSRMIEDLGPAALLQAAPAPLSPAGQRVTVNPDAVMRVASLIADLPAVAPYSFTGPDLPAAEHPAALDYFFAATLQQFGFWTARDGRYERPLIARIDNADRKGAFYLFRAYLRWLDDNPKMLTPAAQADLTEAELRKILRADDGSDPMPALDLHLSLARRYGRDMMALGLTPTAILERVNATSRPLHTLFRLLDHIGGYKEDPLRKKAGLLAIILRQRPERFLVEDGEGVPPVVDYHVMRSCLRIGLIEVADEELAARLVARQLLSDDDEWAVREAAHVAIAQVVEQSGKSMGAVDWFFFQARRRCPEMIEPDCESCAVDPVCAHRKELFQPVLRTSFY